MKLEGKVALVTGASPLIMFGIANALAEEGAKVVSVDIRPELANATADDIKKRGGQAIGLACDVTDEEQVQAAIQRAKEEFGGVDILVNGAVVQIRKGLLEMAVSDWRRQIDVILTGAFLFTKQVAQLMIEQGRKGNIINIVSTEATGGNPGNIGYGTAKCGLLNFTRGVAMELAKYGIRVNSLTPTGTLPDEGVERATQWGIEWRLGGGGFRPGAFRGATTPLGKRPGPEHYGRAAVFLASDDAEMITGFDLRVDAGNVARYFGWTPEPPLTQ